MLQPPRPPPHQQTTSNVYSLMPPGGTGNPYGPPPPKAALPSPLQMPQIPAPPPLQMPTPPKPPSMGGGSDFTNGGMQGLMQYGMQQAVNANVYDQLFSGMGAPSGTGAPSPATAAGTPQPSMQPYGQAQSAPAAPTLPATSSHQAFIQSLLPTAKKWEQTTGIPASVLLAMNISEGNWGAAGNELFGIKGSGTAGSMNSPTWESVNGQAVDTNADFAQYHSPDESYAAFWNLVSTAPRYRPALNALQRGDTQGFLQGLVNGGYATDPTWGQKIMSIAQTTVAPMVGG